MNMIQEAMEKGKFRVILRSKLDGAEFPIYTERQEEAEEAAAGLNAEVVSVSEAGAGQYGVDLLMALARGSNIINE